MSVNQFYLDFHAIEARIKSGKNELSEKPYENFALSMFEQADCKALSLDDSIKAVELLKNLNVKLQEEYDKTKEGKWLSSIAKYKTLRDQEILVFVLYPVCSDDSSAEPKVCVVEIP